MLIKTKYIDCASKSVFNTWKLPTSAADTSGDIYWSAIVYIQDTGEVWTHGKLYGGFFSNADSNKVSLTIGGTTKILALDGHVQSYTTLTGSGTTADQAILSTGVANKWTLKTLGKNAFSNVDYLPADATAVAAEKVVNAMRFQYNGKDMHSFDGSVARLLNIIQGDNVFITGDSQGNVTIAADPGSDTVNTAGATNLIDKKLFLIGAESQTTSPQTYSNQYVYIGTDNCLYSLGKKVLTEHQAIYNLDLQTQVGGTVTKVTTFDPNAANNSFTLVQGTNVTLTPDATNKKVTITSKDTTYDFYNLIFKQGDAIIDTYKPTTSPNKTFKAGTNVTLSGSNNEVTISTLDTRNTAGATDKLATKLFLTGSLTQTDNPQTYTNSKVYIGIDNKLYSDGKVVSTGDHNHDDRYVNTTGDTMTGVLSITCSDTYPLTLNNSLGHLAIIIKNANTNKSRFGWNQEYGSYIYDYTADKYINIKSDSLYWNNSNPFLHTGNYATTLDTRYVKKSGDSMSGVLSITTSDIHPLVITSSNEQETSINVASKGTIGYHSSKGIFLYNKTSDKALEINDDGNAYFDGNKIWHAGNDGPNSGLNADILDDVQLLQKGSTSGVMRSWRRGSFTTVNQYFGNGALVVIDPKPTDSNDLWANTTIFSVGDSAIRNWQMAFGYGADTIKVRRIYDGPTYGNWKTLAYLDSNVASATKLQTARTLWGKSFDGTANVDGCIRIQANEGSYCEGIRIKPHNNSWTTILLGGNDLTSDTGTSANTWSIHNNNGKFYINKNNSNGSTGSELCNVNGNWGIGTVSPSYKLHVGGNAYVASGLTSGGDIILNQNGSTGTRQLRIQCGDNDYGRIAVGATAANAGWMEIATADDGNEPIYVRQYSGVYNTVKRTLTLLDGSGNTSMPGSLTVAGTTTSGNFNTGGRYISNYASNTYINSVTNAVLTCNYSGHGGILCAPVKGGRITLSTYPSNDNMVYLGYATSSQISAGTNALNKQTRWNADNGYWYTDGYVKNGSSDSYVLLGGGGHTTLSGLYTSHNHFERSNVDPNSIVGGPRTYESTSTANRPDTNAWHQYTTLGTGDNNYCHQLSYAYAGGTNIYHRVKNAGSWGSWMTILDSSNYAGILDGRYVNVTGDTMTGKLSWSMNGVTSSISNDNSSFTHHNTNASSGHWFNKAVYVAGEIYAGTSYNQKVWHSGNDGSGSGLDADLLDGKHAASFYENGYVLFGYTINASSLNQNTYYPVIFSIGAHNNVRIECRVSLNSGTKPSWSTHTGGFSVRKIWEVNGSGWGTNPINRHILVSDYAFASADPVRGVGQLSNSSIEYVYVRGGGKYFFYVSHNVTPVLYTSTYTSNSQSVSPTTSAPSLITKNIIMTGDTVSNADTVDGYHANGLFTNLSNSGNNISVTIGGVNRVITPAYASIAGSSNSATYATKVRGEYTGNGGQQKPNYFGVNWVGFRMMNTTVNGNSNCKDWIISDCYHGNDVGGAVAFGINRQTLGAYIMGSDAARTSWTRSGEFWGTWNFNPNTKFNTSGGTISGAVTINNTLSVSKIKATSTYSSNYVFCADGSIRNFPALFSTNILWASYKVNTGGSGSYSRLSGNYTFITGRTREGTGKLLLTITVPRGYSKTQVMMFATGHHRQGHWGDSVYASIQPDYGVSNSVRIMTADDSSLNDAECIVNFILVKTS